MQRGDTFSILEIMIYKNYECSRNRLTKLFYAYPVNDLTTCRKLTADTPDELKQAIDLATENHPLAPWELPYSTAQTIAA